MHCTLSPRARRPLDPIPEGLTAIQHWLPAVCEPSADNDEKRSFRPPEHITSIHLAHPPIRVSYIIHQEVVAGLVSHGCKPPLSPAQGGTPIPLSNLTFLIEPPETSKLTLRGLSPSKGHRWSCPGHVERLAARPSRLQIQGRPACLWSSDL